MSPCRGMAGTFGMNSPPMGITPCRSPPVASAMGVREKKEDLGLSIQAAFTACRVSALLCPALRTLPLSAPGASGWASTVRPHKAHWGWYGWECAISDGVQLGIVCVKSGTCGDAGNRAMGHTPGLHQAGTSRPPPRRRCAHAICHRRIGPGRRWRLAPNCPRFP